MRHATLAAVLLGALSCKQACGLGELTPAGGNGEGASGAGGSGVGAGGNPNGGSGGDGGDGGGVVTGGSGGEGGSCSPPADEPTCGSSFAAIPGCLIWDACTDEPGEGGAAAGDCGTYELLNDALVMTPAPATGYWMNQSEAMFLHTTVPANQAFVAHTTVFIHRPLLPKQWPMPNFTLAGLVAREATVTSALDSTNWIKAEYGTLNGSQGLRVARKTGAINVAPFDENVEDDYTSFHPDAPADVQIAFCRPTSAVIHAYFREADVGSWIAVEPDVNQQLGAAVHVGLVTAATAGGDVVGEFRDFTVVTLLPALTTTDDCLCFLNSLPVLPP